LILTEFSLKGRIGDALNFLTYACPASEYFLSFASFSPRIADLLTAGTEIFSLWARDDMVLPSSLTAHSEQKVKMVGNQRPSIASCPGFFQDISESSQKIVPVGIVLEYSPSFNTPGNDVVKGSRSLPAIASSGLPAIAMAA